MKRILGIIALAVGLGLATSSRAAESLFTDDEVNLFGFGNYTDEADSEWGGGIGASYFFSRHLGLGVSTYWEDFEGSLFDNVAGEAYIRLPLGDLPLAAYGIGSAGYTWEYDNWFFGLGGGAEFRFSKQFGIFGDLQWIFNEAGEDDGVMARLGIRLGM